MANGERKVTDQTGGRMELVSGKSPDSGARLHRPVTEFGRRINDPSILGRGAGGRMTRIRGSRKEPWGAGPRGRDGRVRFFSCEAPHRAEVRAEARD